MTCQLYRHFGTAGELLYVGISISAVGRLVQHKGQSRWKDAIARVEIETFQSREAALAAEARAIWLEKPMHNIVKPVVDLKEIIEAARRDVWLRAWDPSAASSHDDDLLRLCDFLERMTAMDGKTAIEARRQAAKATGFDPVIAGSIPAASAKFARKCGRPLAKDADSTLATTKPWLAEGMSRTTWFRRQKAASK